MGKKSNYRIKNSIRGVFAIATLWLIGSTAQKYVLWTSTGAFTIAGKWKECFKYNSFDKIVFALQLITLFVILVDIVNKRKNE